MVINDHWYAIPDARIKWKIVDSAGAAAIGGELRVNIAEDSSVKLDELRWKAPRIGKYELRAEVFDRLGNRLSENLYEFEVK